MNEKALVDTVQRELCLSALKPTGICKTGNIHSGAAYDTDKYGRIFIKYNNYSGARTIFDGEYESLKAWNAAGIVRMPKPLKVVDLPGGGSAIVMEYLEMTGVLSKYSATLGDQIASKRLNLTLRAKKLPFMKRMHLHNASLKEKSIKSRGSVHKDDNTPEYVSKFGFHINTCTGLLEMDNTWNDDWPSFYGNKVEMQIKLLEEKGDRQARGLWNTLVPKLSKFFEGTELEPALVHGDLWTGNASDSSEGPVMFDPLSYYGHSEYDLSVGSIFLGLGSEFYDAYHKVIPKAPGFKKRQDLYRAFQFLNQWYANVMPFINGTYIVVLVLPALGTYILPKSIVYEISQTCRSLTDFV